MRILNLNPAFCMRAYRQLKALSKEGFEIDLHYLGYGISLQETDDSFLHVKEKLFNKGYPLDHFPRTLISSTYKNKIQRIVREGGYDMVMAHNMPDILGMAAIKYSGLPVIFDERDMTTSIAKDTILGNYIPPTLLKNGLFEWIGSKTIFRRIIEIEKFCLERSDGRTWETGYAYELGRRRYSIPEPNNLVFYNYAGIEDIKEQEEKLSAKDGEHHVVYEGTLALKGNRAPMLEIFKTLSRMKVHIHIYGLGDAEMTNKYRETQKGNPYFHFHGGIPHDTLMRELTRYDWGISPFHPGLNDRDHFDRGLPNKFFDYLAAGLPVMTPHLRSMESYIKEHGVGKVYDDLEMIPRILNGPKPSIDRTAHTIDAHISELVKMIKDVISRPRSYS